MGGGVQGELLTGEGRDGGLSDVYAQKTVSTPRLYFLAVVLLLFWSVSLLFCYFRLPSNMEVKMPLSKWLTYGPRV